MANWAFFSYARADGAAAEKLHTALDRYRTPRDLVGIDGANGPVPAKFHPVFRDVSDLSGGGHLNEKIERALAESTCLVVLCSPAAAASPWVNVECETFIAQGKAARIFPVIAPNLPAAGTRDELFEETFFPPALRGKGFLAADLRETKAESGKPVGDGEDNGRLKLIAGLLGVPLDALAKREARRQRRLVAMLSAAALVFAGVAVAAVWQTVVANGERARAERGEGEAKRQQGIAESNANLAQQREAAERLAREAEAAQRKRADFNADQARIQQLLAQANAKEASSQRDAAVDALARTFTERAWAVADAGNLTLAMRYALAGVVIAPNRDWEHQAILARILQADVGMRRLSAEEDFLSLEDPTQEDVVTRAVSDDGNWVALGGVGGIVLLHDGKSGRLIRSIKAHDSDVKKLAFALNGTRLITLGEGKRTPGPYITYPEDVVRVWNRETGAQLFETTAENFVVSHEQETAILFGEWDFRNDVTPTRRLELAAPLESQESSVRGQFGEDFAVYWLRSGKLLRGRHSNLHLTDLAEPNGQPSSSDRKIELSNNIAESFSSSAMALSPDEQFIVVGTLNDQEEKEISFTGRLNIFGFKEADATLRPIKTIELSMRPLSVGFAGNNSVFVCGASTGGTAGAIYDLASGVKLSDLGGFETFAICTSSATGKQIIAVDQLGQARISVAREGRLLHRLSAPNPPQPTEDGASRFCAQMFGCESDGNTAAFGYWFANDRMSESLPAGLARSQKLAFRIDTNGIEVFDTETGAARRLPGSAGTAIAQLEPKGRGLAAVTSDGRVRMYDVRRNTLLWEYRVVDRGAFPLAFDESGELLLVPLFNRRNQVTMLGGLVLSSGSGAVLGKNELRSEPVGLNDRDRVFRLWPDGPDTWGSDESGRLGVFFADKTRSSISLNQLAASVKSVESDYSNELLGVALDRAVDVADKSDPVRLETRRYLDRGLNTGLIRIFQLKNGAETTLIQTRLPDRHFRMQFLGRGPTVLASASGSGGVWSATNGRLLWEVVVPAAAEMPFSAGDEGRLVMTPGLTPETAQDLLIWDIGPLSQPLPDLRLQACGQWLGPLSREFSDAEVAADPLIRAVWLKAPTQRRDVCEGVRGVRPLRSKANPN